MKKRDPKKQAKLQAAATKRARYTKARLQARKRQPAQPKTDPTTDVDAGTATDK